MNKERLLKNNDNDNGDSNETIVTLKLPRAYYKTAWVISNLLGYKSFDDFVSATVREEIEMQLDGRGELEPKTFHSNPIPR